MGTLSFGKTKATDFGEARIVRRTGGGDCDV